MTKPKTAIEKLAEIEQSLKGTGAAGVPAVVGEVESMKKTKYGKTPNPKATGGAAYVSKGIGHGGAREGAGREPGGTALQKRAKKLLVEKHVSEEIEVTILDNATHKEVKVKKPRVVVAMETLFQLGIKNKDVNALKGWLDRALGKAAQPLIGGDEEDEPIKVDLGIARILEKVYGDDKQ